MKKHLLAALLISLSLPTVAGEYRITFGNSNLSLPEPPTSNIELNHTFTNCSQTGRFGPSLSQCENEYSGQNVLDDGLSFQVSDGIQQLTIPKSGTYRIRAVGAQGGDGDSGVGGYGVYMEGKFDLQDSQTLLIAVGQKGLTGVKEGETNGTGYGGGGGGTFVALSDNTPLIVAGGGNGANLEYDGLNASTATGDGYGLESGDGKGGCGGGFFSGGECSNADDGDGSGFVQGPVGGRWGDREQDTEGGFGGGAGTTYNGSDAGGGYTGGSGENQPSQTVSGGTATASKSYNDGANTTSGTATSGGHGKVVIEFIE